MTTHTSATPSTRSDAGSAAAVPPSTHPSTQLPVWRLNVLRIGYLVMGAGLAVTKWPLLSDAASWGLEEGTIISMLVAMSVLALLGLRYPTRMLPILLFEVGWKAIWLVTVALPLWLQGHLDAATREQVTEVLWVAIIAAVVPWRHVFSRYVTAPGEPLRRHR